MNIKIKNIFLKLQSHKILFLVFFCVTLVGTVKLLLLENKIIEGREYTHYNNYILYKQSFIHLTTNINLYELITNRYSHVDYQYWDFRYSPTFAVYMLPFAYLPTWLGVILWNLLNTFVLFFAIKMLPSISNKIKAFILWFILIENTTAILNTQTNSLIAGLLLFAFVFMEQRKTILATLFIAISIYIKPFGILGFLLFFLYPNKVKFILYSALWSIVLLLLPLLFVSVEQLQTLYLSWGEILTYDFETVYGLSVMGWLSTWFNVNIEKNIIIAIGALILLLPFIKYKMYELFNFRMLIMCSILLWVIIFNYKSESNTFIIADCGVAIWYFLKPRKIGDAILVISVFVFTILSPTDIFPSYLRHNYVEPYVLKVVPCIFVWFKIIYELVTLNPQNSVNNNIEIKQLQNASN